KWSCMRMRSPKIAPPEKGLLGSTATTPTRRSAARARATSALVRVLLPAPGVPVTPISHACRLRGYKARSSSRAPGTRSSTQRQARAAARTCPDVTCSASSSTDGSLDRRGTLSTRLPTGLCLPDSAYRTLPTGLCLSGSAYPTLPTGLCLSGGATASYQPELPTRLYHRLGPPIQSSAHQRGSDTSAAWTPRGIGRR